MSTAPAFPIAATIAGIEVVTIPLRHYAELLDCQRRAAIAAVTPERIAFDARSRLDRDPEVAAFLADCYGRMAVQGAYTSCLGRFGADRTPGRSTIARFWQRVRSGSGK